MSENELVQTAWTSTAEPEWSARELLVRFRYQGEREVVLEDLALELEMAGWQRESTKDGQVVLRLEEFVPHQGLLFDPGERAVLIFNSEKRQVSRFRKPLGIVIAFVCMFALAVGLILGPDGVAWIVAIASVVVAFLTIAGFLAALPLQLLTRLGVLEVRPITVDTQLTLSSSGGRPTAEVCLSSANYVHDPELERRLGEDFAKLEALVE